MNAKILSFEVENFKSFEKSKIVLSPLNVIMGPNDSGKTNLMESIKLAFDCVNYRGHPRIILSSHFGGTIMQYIIPSLEEIYTLNLNSVF